MKTSLTSCVVLLAFSSTLLPGGTAAAQVTSHSPTSKQAPAQSEMLAINPTGRPVARVNGKVLTDFDLVREEFAIFPYARQHNGLPKDLAPQIRVGALKMIVFEELVYQEAQRRKMTIPPATLQRSEQEFRKQFATPEEYSAFLRADFNGSRQALLEKVRRSLLIEALLKAEVDNRSAVGPVELKAYYEKNIQRFTHPEQFRFQTISIVPPQNATAEQLKEARIRAESALKQARATKTVQEFGLLAEKISEDDFRVLMGQHKPMAVGQLPPNVVAALRLMKPDQMSDIIQVDTLLTIVRLQEHIPSGKTSLQGVRAALQKEASEKKKDDLRKAFDRKLHQTAKIEEM